jgi:hypothetical protein
LRVERKLWARYLVVYASEARGGDGLLAVVADETARVPKAAQRVEGSLTGFVSNGFTAASAFPFAQDVEVELAQPLHLLL